MRQGSFFQDFEKLSRLPGFSADNTVKEIKSSVERFPDDDSLYGYLEEAYVRLFTSHRNGIQAPLYESSYVGAESSEIAPLMEAPAVAMKKHLEGRGLSLDSDIHEPPTTSLLNWNICIFCWIKGTGKRTPGFSMKLLTLPRRQCYRGCRNFKTGWLVRYNAGSIPLWFHYCYPSSIKSPKRSRPHSPVNAKGACKQNLKIAESF
jgi:hypothetical protein